MAGGRGFAPSVSLRGPEKSLIGSERHSRYERLSKEVVVEITEHDTLSIRPVVFRPADISIDIWRQTTAKLQGGKINHSGGSRWSQGGIMDKGLLSIFLLKGVKELDLPDINLAEVEKALGLKTKSPTSKV